jgi:hypothetical protein
VPGRPIGVANNFVARFRIFQQAKYADLRSWEWAGLIRRISSRGKMTTVILVEAWNHPGPEDSKAAQRVGDYEL